MALSSLETPPARRFYLLDVVRMLSTFNIVVFHVYSAFIYKEYEAGQFSGSILDVLWVLLRKLTFSGLNVLGISIFLFGYRWPEKPRLRFFLVLTGLGTLLLLIGQGDHFLSDLVWEWDIYHLLLTSLLLLFFLSSHLKWAYALGGIGLGMTFVPVWQWSDSWNLQPILRDIFFGTCDGSGRGGWALFPNIGFVLFHFAIGRFLRNCYTRFKLNTMISLEIGIWIALLALSFFHLGEYDDVKIGPGFYCYIFRKPPLVFWSHYIWILFFIRLSVMDRVNYFLGNLAFIRGIANTEWSRSFGLCYFLQLVLIFTISTWSEYFPLGSWRFDLFFLSVIPVVEILARACKKLFFTFKTLRSSVQR
jgi:hypothetical protein